MTDPTDDPIDAPTNRSQTSPAAEPTPSPATGGSGGGGGGGEIDFVDPSAGDVTRNGDGEIVPEIVQAGHLGKVKAKPMAYGTVQEYFGSGTTSNLGPSELATLFRNHIVQPDLDAHYDGLDGETIEKQMKPLTPRAYLQALMDVSDIETEQIEMYEDGSADVEVSGNRT